MSAKAVDGAAFMAAERLRWTERQFQDAVTERARAHGWSFVYHTYRSTRSDHGFPDLVLVRPQTSQVVFVELKAMKGKLSIEQEAWQAALAALQGDGTVRIYLWRPCCWNSGEIEAVLR